MPRRVRLAPRRSGVSPAAPQCWRSDCGRACGLCRPPRLDSRCARPWDLETPSACDAAAARGPLPAAAGNPWCILCGEYGAQDFVANILLFVPFGAGLSLAGVSRRRALAVAALTTLCIELLQVRVV